MLPETVVKANADQLLAVASSKDQEGLQQALRDMEALDKIKYEKIKHVGTVNVENRSFESQKCTDGQVTDVVMVDALSERSQNASKRAPFFRMSGALDQDAVKKLRRSGSTGREDEGATMHDKLHKPQSKQDIEAVGKSLDLQTRSEASLDSPLGLDFGLDGFVNLRRGAKPMPRPSPVQPPRDHYKAKDFHYAETTGSSSAPARPARHPVAIDPALKISPPANRRHFVLSTSLLPQRSLLGRIRALDPRAVHIERDFMQHAAIASQASLADEADLLLSSSTGMIFTTLPHLRQVPLPGSRKLPAVRERLLRIAQRYAKLVVLVTSGAPNEQPGMSASDALAVAELQGFVRSRAFAELGTTVEVTLALGGEEVAARWVVMLMGKQGMDCGIEVGDEGPQEIESELRLREVGLNALAAMTVLENLQSLGGEGSMRDFVAMGEDVRREAFEQLLGQKVLARVEGKLRMMKTSKIQQR